LLPRADAYYETRTARRFAGTGIPTVIKSSRQRFSRPNICRNSIAIADAGRILVTSQQGKTTPDLAS
jgi:hypothetical protein